MKLPQGKERQAHLDRVEARRRILETSVQAVVQGFSPALFVWGPAGLGKTHVLTTLLDGLCPGVWKHHTAYSTPKALMLAIAESPASLHLFEDCEKMLKTDLSASILRAACGAPGERMRWVTYETAHERFKVNFTGGILIATNSNLSRQTGPLQGVASRFRPICWSMTLDERLSVISQIADYPFSKGKVTLSESECHKVAVALVELVEQQADAMDLDIRLFTEHALPAYAHAKHTGQTNWQDVLLAKLSGVARTEGERQDEKTSRLQTLAEFIDRSGGTTKSKVGDWRAKTGLGQAIYYRHLKRAQARGR